MRFCRAGPYLSIAHFDPPMERFADRSPSHLLLWTPAVIAGFVSSSPADRYTSGCNPVSLCLILLSPYGVLFRISVRVNDDEQTLPNFPPLVYPVFLLAVSLYRDFHFLSDESLSSPVVSRRPPKR